ncbi:sugar kinase [Actinorhabdospora filicis]|uniref:Sugar kinase n=1 Tax=Actinorhabdospora filicis TaxID=1785913 RepID=A0A9W6SJH4_9ACTN|nr:ROK family protein [Actinorhabdospora filicis]GLZ77082.1 sugar kinase [Actinorhabdospora filicis]
MSAPEPKAAMGDVVIAVDVGGTLMKCALVSTDGRVLHSVRRPTDRERGPEAVVDAVLGTVADLVAQARGFGGNPLAVGLTVPGVVDSTKGVAVFASNLGWRDVPFRALVEERVGLPAALGHDVRTGALAEARLGAGRGSEYMLFVAIGTGIAAGYFPGGKGLDGAHGSACEIGHISVRPDGPQCGCGQRGCVEVIASAASLARRYQEATGENLGAAEVAHKVAEGDAVAGELWAETVEVLADGLLIGMALYDPDTIVLGGGLAEAGPLLLEPLEARLRAKATFHTVPRLVHAELGDEAGCIGASLIGLDRMRETAP